MMVVRTLRFVFCTLPLLLWILLREKLFTLLLLPAFVRFAWFYWVSSDRRVAYYKDDSVRNEMDIYGSTNGNKKPVLLFFPGGAWIIGYKMWGAFLARTMVRFGVLVMIADYRNHPFGNVPEMVQDAQDAILWAKNNCATFGGDPKRMVVAGQSAGGHLLMCLLLRKAMVSVPDEDASSSLLLPKRDICGAVALSAPLDMSLVEPFFAKYGLYPDFVSSLFGERLCDFDPFRLASMLSTRSLSSNHVAKRFPPIRIFHGTDDGVVPSEGAVRFEETLHRDLGLHDVGLTLYPGWSHTDPILEGLMEGKHDFHRDLMDLMKSWTCHDVVFDDTIRECQPLCPSFLIRMARYVNPFH